MLYGRTNAALPSRFLREIPENTMVKKGGYHTPYGTRTEVRSPVYNTPVPQKTNSYKSAYSTTTTSTNYLELNKGDMVQHTAFGRGLVLSVMKMGGDALLEIAFDQIGTKKLMAKAASAHLKKL